MLLEYRGGSQAFCVQIQSLGSWVTLGRPLNLSVPRFPHHVSITAPTSKLCWEDAMGNALCNIWHVTNTSHICHYVTPSHCFLCYYYLLSQLSSTLRIQGNGKPVFVYWGCSGPAGDLRHIRKRGRNNIGINTSYVLSTKLSLFPGIISGKPAGPVSQHEKWRWE